MPAASGSQKDASRAHSSLRACAAPAAGFIVNGFRARYAARRGRACGSAGAAQAQQTFCTYRGEFGSVGVMHLCPEAISPCSYSLP
jgi:hypothetical protein